MMRSLWVVVLAVVVAMILVALPINPQPVTWEIKEVQCEVEALPLVVVDWSQAKETRTYRTPDWKERVEPIPILCVDWSQAVETDTFRTNDYWRQE
jgi:hypothetical protein